ncbi:WD40/YVTN/BNR-like repeat-containing protein [Aridibaculum aurantiacum]|uniref:WD40/YVTN/BNR-like repeat-containing protein n=1 Tax=Aridibaculum aurantiacum TaxID=2810307 RepID=UPI001A97C790|nr:hypothetical protein [Aridibaculum aurantiacum]
MKSIQQRKSLQQNSLVNHISFRNIGPTVMSGRVVDIEVNPSDATEFYVAYATGGLWHSTNNGQSFSPIFDSEDVLFIGDIAVNWQEKNRVIWVGTGEVNSSRSSYAGIGVYKSNNNGKSWEYLGLPESHHIGKIQLHPTDPNTAWVAVLGHLYSPNKERGVYKTTDGGKSWKQTLAIDENTGVVEMDINPANPNELYAATWYRTRRAWNFEEGGKTSGIYKSTDGGNTWNLLTTAGAGFPTGDNVGRIGVAVYPKNPQVVYAIVDNQNRRPDTAQRKADTSRYELKEFHNLTREKFLALEDRKIDSFIRRTSIPRKYTAKGIKELVANNQLKPTAIYDYLYNGDENSTPVIGAEVYRSNDGGRTWQKMNQKGLDLYSSFGYYFGKIYVSPSNENKVVILGIDLLASTDGGKTFKSIDRENVHADHHALWINPNRDGHMLNGNDGGLNITYDDGKNWSIANTPPVGQYYAINVDNARPYNVFGGLQDNGTWYGPSNHRENARWHVSGDYPFKSIGGGDGMQVQVDTRDNQTVYTGSQFGVYVRQNLRNRQDRRFIRPSNDLGEAAYRFNWQSPILLSPHHQDVLYFGTNRFHRSMNKGDTLPAISPDLTTSPQQGDVPYGTLTTISESPLKFGLIYTGTDDGNIHVSRDGGYNWTLISGKLPKGLWVSRVVASAYKEGRVYASLNGYRNDNFMPYLFVSDDYGTNWRSIAANLPFEPINVVKEDTRHDSLLYVGTDGGLYVTADAGRSYFAWTNGLPKSVPIHDLVIQQRENELVLGTHGRSLYIAKLDSVQLLMTNATYRKQKEAEVGKGQAVITPINKVPARKSKSNTEGAQLDGPSLTRKD